MPIEEYYISIIDGDSEDAFNVRKLMRGSTIKFSLSERHERSRRMERYHIDTLEAYAEHFIENDESYMDVDEQDPNQQFFCDHYKDIFAGKYPEWIIYGIRVYHDGYTFNFVRVNRTMEAGIGGFGSCQEIYSSHCWLISDSSLDEPLQVIVSHPNRPPEKYLIGGGYGVAEFEGSTRREYSFYKKKRPDYEGEIIMAEIKEFSLL